MAVAAQYQSFEPTIEEIERLQAAQIEQLKAQLALLTGDK